MTVTENKKRMSEEYPNDQDMRVVVEEKYGLGNTQRFLKSNSRVVVHTDKKANVSRVFQRSFIGYEKLQLMKDDVLNQESTEKATAFIVESGSSDEELIDELISYKNTEEIFDKNKELEIKTVSDQEKGIKIILSYIHKKSTKQSFLSSQKKTVEFTLDSPREDGTRIGRQEYRSADEFRAVADFFDRWEQIRVQDRKPLIKRLDISLDDIADVSDRVELVDDFLQNIHEGWKLNYLLELGIEQEGQSEFDITEIESEEEVEISDGEIPDGEISQDLRRITNAILKGRGLRESEFVTRRVGEGDFYFISFRGFFKNLSTSDRVEVEIKFKKKPGTFDLQIKSAAEENDKGELDPKRISPSWRSDLQDLFRGVLLQYYGDYIDQPELFSQKSHNALEDVNGIGPAIAENLRAEGIKEPADLMDVDKEFLVKIDLIGDGTAENILEKNKNQPESKEFISEISTTLQ